MKCSKITTQFSRPLSSLLYLLDDMYFIYQFVEDVVQGTSSEMFDLKTFLDVSYILNLIFVRLTGGCTLKAHKNIWMKKNHVESLMLCYTSKFWDIIRLDSNIAYIAELWVVLEGLMLGLGLVRIILK